MIELTVALAIGVFITGTAIMSLNALTSADLRSTAIELSGAIKMNYDRAVMYKRTQRIGINIDKGLWWIDFTEDQFALAQERATGTRGEDDDEKDKKGALEDFDSDSIFDDDVVAFACIDC